MHQPVLKLAGVNKRISDFFTLHNISLDLYAGEVHALIGENGSGKSSLMNILSGTYPKDSGEIFLNGKPVLINSPMDAKRLGIAMIHQESFLFEHFSVAENIFIDQKPYSNKVFKLIDLAKMFNDCQQLFNKLGFPLSAKTVIKHLNSAQKQLVEIAKAYVSDARIIIMDEPTSSLTDAESSLLFNIIRELKKSGVAIFYISHRLEDIRQIGDRVTVIREGEIVGTQDITSMNVDHIINMMTGMELKERYPKLSVKTGKEILRVSGLYSGSTLENINFSLKKREILGITGLIGSGRTKIAKSIFGLDKIDSGEIFIEGNKTIINSPVDAIKSGIGYITEDRNTDGLFMYLNIPENISAPNMPKVSRNLMINLAKERDITTAYIDRLGIKTGTINDKVAYLSGGNQQKVIWAKWIMSKSRIFILDEPTRGIDIASKVDVYNLMNEMVSKGASIILISSDVDEIIGMCDRIMVLYMGRVSAIIPRSEATQEKILYYATGGKNPI